MAYAPDGTIVWASFNWPGSQHDSRLAEGLYTKLENTATGPDGRVFTLAADAAFKKGSHIFKPLRRDAVEKMMGDLDMPIEDVLGRLRGHRACVSARQASEWGMRAVQSSFKILKTTLTTDEAERRRIIHVCFLMYNLRVRRGLPNQIRTVYDKNYVPPMAGRRAGQPLHDAMLWDRSDCTVWSDDLNTDSEIEE